MEPQLVKKDEKSLLNQKKYLILSIVFVVVLFISSSYALLTNFDTADNVVNVSTGNLNMTINNTDSLVNHELSGKYPETDANGFLNASPITLTFTNTGTMDIMKYVVKLMPDSDPSKVSTLSTNCIKYAISLNLADTLEDSIVGNLGSNNSIIFTGYFLKVNSSKTIYLRLWIDGEAGNDAINKTFYGSVNVDLYQKADVPAGEVVKANIKSNNTSSTCQNANLAYTEDGITYISGSSDCIDFNYLWYSGKLWRIVAIYPDGSMKLVTENAITAMQWGSDTEYNGSWMYQWLNEDFYDTLVSPESVLKTNAVWNYSTDDSATPVRPETIETQKTKEAPVGLLNAYEYYSSYRCNNDSSCSGSTYGTGYLKNVYWWLITPYSGSRVRNVVNNGNLYYDSPSLYSYGARPSIILQSGISLSGSGTKTEPYRLVGIDTIANIGDSLYSRYSGEYVNFNNEKYRIVSTENNITKLTKFDYIKSGTTVVTKNFASSAYFKKDGNTQEDTYWDYYLNNNTEGGWLYGISSTYKNMMVDGTYYLGTYSSNTNYKAIVCKDDAATLNSTSIKNCTKYTSSDTDKTFTGKVGLSRVGEMFSALLKVSYNSYSTMWLITPYSGSSVLHVDSRGDLNNYSPSSDSDGVRPSITLSSEVKIACNSSKCDGTEEYPYDLTM